MSTIRLSSILAILAVIAATTVAPAKETSPTNSIVRVNATLQGYNFLRPWEKGAPTPRRGLGAVLEGNRVLVTAELCVNSTFLELEHPSSGDRVPARIAGLDYEANLAVLEPSEDDSGVFDHLEPLQLDATAQAGDQLDVWQIEDNGEGVTTQVEVLRVNVGRYFIPQSVFLLYQVKGSLQARVNSFTLPLVRDGKLSGMLLSYSSKEQTATVLPAPIIRAFLADLEDGDYDGFPTLGVQFAKTLDETLREFSGIDGQEGGVFLRKIARESSAEKAGLQEGDVILSIDGHPIDSRGNYEHPKYGALKFSHLVRGGADVGDVLDLEIIREGKRRTLEVELVRKQPQDYLVDPYMFDRGPKFLIYGGLIFQELTLPYLESWGDEWPQRAPFRLVHANANPETYAEKGREKLVFLSNVLKTPSSLGYEEIQAAIVTEVDGTFIKNIRDLARALAKVPENGIHTIEFGHYPEVIHVDEETSRMVNRQLAEYGIGQLRRLD